MTTGAEADRDQDTVRRKGLRCQICTGCGLCPGIITDTKIADSLHVLAEDALLGAHFPIEGSRRLAVADIGTTTVAILLYGRDGSVADRYMAVNPQTSYGADVLSRVRAAEDPKAAGEMKRQIRQVLEQGLGRFRGGLADDEELYLVMAANTTMNYLMMGWDASELGSAPFHASCLQATETRVKDVSCFLFPGLSAFVGGDIAAGMLACGMCEREELTLLLDLGTNGEIVLGNRNRRIACATAAGPAFEGGPNRGVWGADMISLLARLKKEGLLDETGLLAEPWFSKGIRIGNVLVTQEAVRSIQLAKAAIAAGIEVMLAHYGAKPEHVARVVLAGGFGYYLKPKAAAAIGLLPKQFTERTVTGGNTALSGALLAGRQILGEGSTEGLKKRLEETVLQTEVINLARQPQFEKLFVDRMNFG